MINVSNNFKLAMKQPIKEIDAYINTENQSIKSADDLISYKISCDTDMCKTAMRKLEGKILGDYDLLGKWVNVGFGVRLADRSFEYLDFGSFLITKITTSKDSGVTQIEGYDKMVLAMTEYTPLDINYPIGLYDYTVALCEHIGLEISNDTFVNNDWVITQDLWENINGITYRDILVQIAQATASTCIINSDNQICFKYINQTNEELTYDNMFKLKLEPIYGEINSVVLSRTPQEDNIYLRDDSSIEVNGLTEFRIENNEIVDKDRDSAITPIYNTLHGISYYPFETTTEGFGWYEIGDSFIIVNDLDVEFNCVLFNHSITIDGGIREILKASATSKTQTQYQYATPMGKRIKNTEIITNKQQQTIDSLVSDMYDEDGIINENFTQIHQDIEKIITSVQNSGGANMLKNSVMFAYDNNGVPNEWTVEGAGTLSIQASAEAMSNGSLSGHTFTLNNKTIRQRVYVKPADGTENQSCYTFSTKIKKNTTGTCYVKIFNDNEEYRIDIPSGESVFYKDYEIKALLPSANYYDIELYGSTDSDATFTDNMFAIGEYRSQWQQASGEIMNTQVNINVDGILVKSSVYLGDYTIMSPLEFAGYSNINGITTKVFTINKDTTEVEKLKVKKGISMPPIKIVPVTTGNLLGWAFVPIEE
jgi:hypothetical protein